MLQIKRLLSCYPKIIWPPETPCLYNTKENYNFIFSSFPVIFHLEMIIFAIENKVFFEAMQNKERERNSLVSIS